MIESKTTIRPDRDDVMLATAIVIAQLGTCSRRKTGAILVNKHHHIIGTGYNGNASGMSHCIDSPCKGASFPSGTKLSECEAIHAEQNALLQCNDVHEIVKIYSSTPPCPHCTKLLLNTGCQEIVMTGEYPSEKESRELWERAGRIWRKM